MGAEPQPTWYRISDLARVNTPARFLLHGGECTGIMLVDQKSRERSWRVRRDSGALDVLPYEPIAWRPVPGQPWPDALPEPLSVAAVGRFVDIRPRKLAAMQRQAEQSAAVMAELEREHGPLYPVLPGASDDQWWLDPEGLTYSAAGEISLLEAEARVSRAILTDGIRNFDTKRGFEASTGDSALGSFIADSISADGLELIKHFKPTRRDISDYPVAFGWFTAIAPIELRPQWAKVGWFSGAQKVLVWRALVPQKSWRQIAQRAGGSQEGWRKAWGGALECVRRVANGNQPLLHVKVSDQLAALRERNMAWKRKRHDPAEILTGALKAMEPADAD